MQRNEVSVRSRGGGKWHLLSHSEGSGALVMACGQRLLRDVAYRYTLPKEDLCLNCHPSLRSLRKGKPVTQPEKEEPYG